MEYTAVIRTLGKAGMKYQQLLNSLNRQTIKPKKILVYIADGFDIPKETIGWEEYIYVKKGMVAQRALNYEEVETEFILFLDDDLSFPENTVEKMFSLMQEEKADVISPDIFPNAERPLLSEIMMFISGRMIARRNDAYWGYKVMRNSGYSYNKNPTKELYWSQTNAGACFFCSKNNFFKIHFEDEIWMDKMDYALGDDQVMYYKMYLYGLKQLTWYKHKFVHLDAGCNMQVEKEKKVIYSDFRFKIIFWHRFIYKPDRFFFNRILSVFSIIYFFVFSLLISLVKGNLKIFCVKKKAIIDGIKFIKSAEYKSLPLIINKNL